MHTPGPWQANPIGVAGRCSISAPHPKGGGQNVVDECLEADARLIAAAPELLAALHTILFQVVQGPVLERDACITQARAAWAKAGGNNG